MNTLDRVLIKFGALDRCQMVLAQCPLNTKEIYLICVQMVKHVIHEIQGRPNDASTQFLFHLFAATRGFEGYDTYLNFRKETILYFKTDPYGDNLFSINLLHDYVIHPPEVFEFDNQKLLQEARKQFSKDKVVLTNLCQFKVTQYFIDKFFQQNKNYYFIDQSNKLRGLSSFDGLTTFVNYNYPKEKQKKTLLHEWCHNFPRFLWKNKDPLYLSPKKNRNLKMYVTEQERIVEFEGGEYFNYCCLNIRKKLSYTPFALQVKK